MIISGTERHSFICSDTHTGKLIVLDQDGCIVKEICGAIGAFDIWVLPDGKILYAHNSGLDTAGVTLLNVDGSINMKYLTGKELFSCQYLENGHILLGLLNDPQLLEIDLKGNTVNEIPVPYEGSPHEGMRIARKAGDAYYVIQPGSNTLRKISLSGTILKEFDIHSDAFGLVVTQNNTILYTCMSGAYELDENGNETWSLTADDVPEINIRWLLGVQLLANGNFAFANWMGHGHLDEGIHFFEVDRKKSVVWSFDGRGNLQTPATLQILDEDAANVCFTPMK